LPIRLGVELLEERSLPSVFTVTSLGDAGTGSGASGDLRYCLNQAQIDAGDTTINFGVTGRITVESGLPTLLKTDRGQSAGPSLIILQGPGADSLDVQRDPSAGFFSIFTVGHIGPTASNVAVRISGLTISGGNAGSAGYGGGLENYGPHTVVANSVFTDDDAQYGGAIDNIGTLSVTDCTFSGNSASYGGAVSNRYVLTLTGDTIAGNAATLDGGGIDNMATLTVAGSTISGNTAGRNGGGLANSGTLIGVSHLVNTAITTNAASFDGGGIYNYQYCGLIVSGSMISQNVAGQDGGGIGEHSFSGAVTIDQSTIDSNSANRYGGGIRTGMNASGPTVTYSAVTHNTAGSGGGIYTDFTLSLGGLLTIAWSTVATNTATGDGGGLFAASPAAITASTFSGNTAGGNGGGLNAGGPFGDQMTTIASSTIAGNSATSGGGLFGTSIGFTPAIHVQASTIAANQADGTAQGGGIRGNVTLESTIVANNLDPAGTDDISGNVVSGNYDLVGDATGATFPFGSTGNQIGTAVSPIDPMLGPLQDNGGPTQTMALLAGSPAIDAGGLVHPPAADQRGQPRIVHGRIDIGAFELAQDWPAVNHYTVTTLADGGPGSLRDAITQADADPLDLSLIDFGVSGTIVLSSALPALAANIDIEGPGADMLTVMRNTAVGTPVYSVFTVTDFADPSLFGVGGPVVQVAGLTVTGGAAANGGGVFVASGTLTLSGDVLTGNTATTQGGGAYAAAFAFLNVIDCTITQNTAANGGGGISNRGTLTITGSMLSNNTVSTTTFGQGSQGGALYNAGSAAVTATTFAGNLATGSYGAGGGAIYDLQGSPLTVDGSTFTGNAATGSILGGAGGAIYVVQGTQPGGPLLYGAQVVITNSTFSGNSAGGGTGGSGGAVCDGQGSGIELGMTIADSTFVGNSATVGGQGGAIYNVAYLTVTESSFFDNQASGDQYAVAYGGAIANDRTARLIVAGSTFASNSAVSAGPPASGYYGYGGAIYNAAANPVTITNSTLFGNSASDGGGAIYQAASGSVVVNNSTVAGNQVGSAGHGGGLDLASVVAAILYDTIVAGNLRGTANDDVYGVLDAVNSLSNLIGDGTGSNLINGSNGNLVGTHDAPIDPLLGPLQDNGGPTWTMALLDGSPALGAGDSDGVSDTDQRSLPRVVNGRIDIGAFEVQPPGGP
jgi:hypothetical protein